MNKKIAILTFVHAYNYGAELQCFALQYKLKLLGYDVTVIDISRPDDKDYFHSKDDTKRFAPLFAYDSKKDFRAKINRVLSDAIFWVLSFFKRKEIKKRDYNFTSFISNNVSLSKIKFHSFSELYEYCHDDFSHWIVGSDQIWNYTSPYSIEPYFLTFKHSGVNISYAASIGHSELPEQISRIYGKWLDKFDHISIREEQGALLVSSLIGKEVPSVVDPTLLLSKKEWGEWMQNSDNNRGDYVAVYLLSYSNEAMRYATEIAKILKSSIYVITTNIWNQYANYKDVKVLIGESPSEFVSLFYHAKFIVTNSFHGTAFSVNFGKPFITVTRKSKRVNSRFFSLLSKTGLEKRLVFEGEKVDVLSLIEIDSLSSEQLLAIEREKSLDFLKKALM